MTRPVCERCDKGTCLAHIEKQDGLGKCVIQAYSVPPQAINTVLTQNGWWAATQRKLNVVFGIPSLEASPSSMHQTFSAELTLLA